MPPTGIRNVADRLAYYQEHGAPRAGLCASAVRAALNAPLQGHSSAAVCWAAVPVAERRSWNAPRGAIVYWTGGQHGYGHTCFALGDHLELSVDVRPGWPGKAGVVPFGWFAEQWPSLRYAGWSWWWGGIDTREHPLHTQRGPQTA